LFGTNSTGLVGELDTLPQDCDKIKEIVSILDISLSLRKSYYFDGRGS
jgi:hypothetical protein